jgi:hypothetical protein
VTYPRAKVWPSFEDVLNSAIIFGGTKNSLENLVIITLTDIDSVNIFAYQNMSYLGADIERFGDCLPGVDYVWGFSSLMLFSFCVVTLPIALLLAVSRNDAYLFSSANKSKFHISPCRDLLDLAQELRAHFDAAEAAYVSAKKPDKAMEKDAATTGLEIVASNLPRAVQWYQSFDA